MTDSLTKLYAIVAGVQYDLSNGVTYRLGEENLGVSPVDYLSETGPYQDGETLTGVRLKPRFIQLLFGMDGLSEAQFYDLRRTAIKIFKPTRSLIPIQLLFNLPNGESYQIDSFFAGQMGMSSSQRKGFTQDFVVTLRCPDPLFYSPSIQTVRFGVGGTATGMTVPLTVPFGVGSSTLAATRSVTYDGDWDENPYIRIQGPIVNPKITNSTTGEVLDFTGYSLTSTEYIEIDTRYNFKTVVDQAGVNRLDKLTDASDLATFHLASDPDAPGGVNSITATGTGINNVTEIFFQYRDRYIGF